MPEREELHVVSLSGGKDSTALALRLAEVEPRDYTYICTPTGDELPSMIEHWENLECMLRKPLIRLGMGLTLNELIEREKTIPNWKTRYCTRILKIQPCQDWINSRREKVILYVGLRADEEGREGGDYSRCEVRFPFREWDWGIRNVLDYLKARNVKVPPRTDCARCFFQKTYEWWKLWQWHPSIYQSAVDQEMKYGHTFRSAQRDTWPASLAGMRLEFMRGRVPVNAYRREDPFGFSANKCRVCSL